MGLVGEVNSPSRSLIAPVLAPLAHLRPHATDKRDTLQHRQQLGQGIRMYTCDLIKYLLI